jgi:hypothetical protein
MNSVDKHIQVLKQKAEGTTWLPPVVTPDGRVENIIQGRVRCRGADKGETNYKTRKRQTRYGQYEMEQGTFVANNHFETLIEGTEVVKTSVDPETGKKTINKYVRPETSGFVADGDGEIRILKLGRTVKLNGGSRKEGLGWNRMFTKAADRAKSKLQHGNCNFQKNTADDAQRGRAGVVKGSAVCRETNVFEVGGLRTS